MQIINVPGRPIPYVRMTQKSKYTNERAIEYLEFKEFVGYCAINCELIPKPKLVDVMVLVFIKKGAKVPFGKSGDIDNYCKSALDGLNKILWDDDKQVKRIIGEKFEVEDENAEGMTIYIKERARDCETMRNKIDRYIFRFKNDVI